MLIAAGIRCFRGDVLPMSAKSKLSRRRHWGVALAGASVLMVGGFAAEAVAAQSAAAQQLVPDRQALRDFGGVWALDRSLEVLARPRRPGPMGLPRGWKGLAGWTTNGNTPPPLRPQILAGIKMKQSQELSGRLMEPRAAACKSAGIFDLMSGGSRIDIFQRWNEVVMLVEGARSLPRHIYIGHQHAPPDELNPSVIGHSVAQWEGDVLVVDTLGIEPDAYFLSADYIPQSEQIHVVERLRLQGADTLLDTLKVEDPKVLTQAWTLHLIYHKQPPGTQLSEAVCTREKWSTDVPH
jgi:hypothetical protein